MTVVVDEVGVVVNELVLAELVVAVLDVTLVRVVVAVVGVVTVTTICCTCWPTGVPVTLKPKVWSMKASNCSSS